MHVLIKNRVFGKIMLVLVCGMVFWSSFAIADIAVDVPTVPGATPNELYRAAKPGIPSLTSTITAYPPVAPNTTIENRRIVNLKYKFSVAPNSVEPMTNIDGVRDTDGVVEKDGQTIQLSLTCGNTQPGKHEVTVVVSASGAVKSQRKDGGPDAPWKPVGTFTDKVLGTVKVTFYFLELSIYGPSITIDGLDTRYQLVIPHDNQGSIVKKNIADSFSAEVPFVSPDSYTWTASSPNGSANSPDVPFTNPSSGITDVSNPRWFAMPIPDSEHNAPSACIYTIDCTVVVKGVTLSEKREWIVYVPTPAADTWSLVFKGAPHIAEKTVNGKTIFYVDGNTGDNPLRRSMPETFYHIPWTSQFFDKIKTHEERHQAQWTTIVSPNLALLPTLWDANALLGKFLLPQMEADSQDDLLDKIYKVTLAQHNIDFEIVSGLVNQMEIDAYAISAPVPPLYLNHPAP